MLIFYALLEMVAASGKAYITLGVIFRPGGQNTLQALFSVPHPNFNPINTNPNPNSPNHRPNHTPRTENSLEQIKLSIPGAENIIYVYYCQCHLTVGF